jgi:hypothetical protein
VTTQDQVIRNINSLIHRTTPLQGVLAILEETGIRYGLYAGSHVAVLTNNRPPTDVDILVHDDDIDELKKALPSARISETKSASFLYVGDDNLTKARASTIAMICSLFLLRLRSTENT